MIHTEVMRFASWFGASIGTLVLFGSAAHAQSPIQPLTSQLIVDAPFELRELADGFRFDVVGAQVIAPLHRLSVRLNDQPINGSITMTPSTEERDDENGDGILEHYRVTYDLAWNAIDPSPGDVVTIIAEILSPAGTVEGRTAVRIIGHAESMLTNFVEGQGSATAPAMLTVLTFDATVTAQSVKVYAGGHDVTALVNVAGPFTDDEFMSSSDPSHVDYRFQHYEIDLSPLAPAAPTQVTTEVTLFTPKGSTSSTAVGKAVVAGAVDAWQKWAIELCLKRMKISKEDGPGGKVKIGATPKEVKAAIDQLQQNLDPNEPPHPDNPEPGPGTPAKSNKKFPGSPQSLKDFAVADDVVLKNVVICVASDNESATAMSSSADVVIAVGGDSSGTNEDAGSASATNSTAGGVAIAAGGDGHFANAAAGDGTAVAKSGGGTALGMGGNSMPTAPNAEKHPGAGSARSGKEDGTVEGDSDTGGGGFVEVGAQDDSGKLTDDC